MLECTTVRPGHHCPLMSRKGCAFTDGACSEIVEQCKGCNHIVDWQERKYCDVFPNPTFKWSYGYCNFATHVKVKVEETKRINPLKASKMAARGKH